METVSWLGVDWQSVEAIGTWFAAIALGLFAYLTWRVSTQQSNLARQDFQAIHEPELLVHPRIWEPEVGKVRRRSGNIGNITLEFSGIAWDLRLFNCGGTIIAVRSVTADCINEETNARVPLGHRPSLDEALAGARGPTEFPHELHVMGADADFLAVTEPVSFPVFVYPVSQRPEPLSLSVWVYEEDDPSVLAPLGRRAGEGLKRDIELHSNGTCRRFRLEVDIQYECLGASTKRPKFATVRSVYVTIGPDVEFAPPMKKTVH